MDSGGISPTLRLARARAVEFLRRLRRALDDDHVSLVAAGVAFYSFLAVMPALAALVSLYGLVFDADDVIVQLSLLRGIAPEEVLALLSTEAQRLIAIEPSALGLGVVGGVMVAIWSATKGARALIEAMNIIYGDRERRRVAQLYWVSALFTVVALLAMTLVLLLLVTLPALSRWLPADLRVTVDVARWIVVFAGVLFAIGAVYRFGPCTGHGRWITPGSVLATLLWLFVSWSFHMFVEHVASYSASFGSVGTVAVFLMWLYLSALSLLVGAEVDVAHFGASR